MMRAPGLSSVLVMALAAAALPGCSDEPAEDLREDAREEAEEARDLAEEIDTPEPAEVQPDKPAPDEVPPPNR